MKNSQQLDRRQFLKTGALAAVAAPTIIPAAALGQAGKPAPSNRITVGLIGCGARGISVMNSFLNEATAQVVAVCDPYKLHYRGRTKGRELGRQPAAASVGKKYDSKPCATHADYRRLCAREDIDAVIVATPDHWHAVQVLEALRNGKDIYCEKPVTHFFGEGQALYREVAKRKAIFLTGSQQRSTANFHRGVELVRNGVIGLMKEVKVGLPKGPTEIRGVATEEDRSKREDYQLWTGPSPLLPYVHARHHQNWRLHLAYGGGQLMDWIGHHNDIAHWGLGEDAGGPTRVKAKNFNWSPVPSYHAPVQYEVHCEYAGGVRSSIGTHNTMGTRFIGEDGWVYVNRGKLEASNPNWLKPGFVSGDFKAYKSTHHVRNFLDCVKSRKPAICTAETSHRSITPGHLGYVSEALGRALKWDPKNEQIVGDTEADTLLNKMHHRSPWTL